MNEHLIAAVPSSKNTEAQRGCGAEVAFAPLPNSGAETVCRTARRAQEMS